MPLLALALLSGAAVFARAQQEDEEIAVRGSFLTTRSKSSSNTSSSNLTASVSATATQAAGSTGNNSTGNKSTGGKSSTGSMGSKSGRSSSGRTNTGVGVSAKGSVGNTSSTMKGNAAINAYVPSAIGLGYTLYMRAPDGGAVRVDPTREFHAGDRIRLSLESNTDGYLYIFHTENDGTPEMLYPDVRLSKGENRIEAHVPYEIPWNEPGVENWFRFDENPANERLFVVITRQPLPGIPVGSALVDYCGQNRCPWQPSANAWAQVRVSAQAKVGVVKSSRYGQKQSLAEREATTRGLGLDQAAPEPSVIRMNVSSDAPILVTAVDLIHK